MLRDAMEDIDAVGRCVTVGAWLGVADGAGCGVYLTDTNGVAEDGVAVWRGLRVSLVAPTTTVAKAHTTIRSILSCYSVFILTVICIDSNSRVYNPMQYGMFTMSRLVSNCPVSRSI